MHRFERLIERHPELAIVAILIVYVLVSMLDATVQTCLNP